MSAAVYALVWLVPGILGHVVGQGLRRGRRAAVYGLVGLAALALGRAAVLAGLGWYGLTLKSTAGIVLLAALWAVAYVPPLLSVRGHMDAFRKAN